MTKKYIYKITNLLNNAVYIGQTIDPERRWKEHQNKTEQYISLIHCAIKTHGEENFSYEILEGPIENYNDREKYWINYYHCYIKDPLYKKGYNLTPGGEEPPVLKGEESPFSLHSKEQVELAKFLLKETNMDLDEIAKLAGYCDRSGIERINVGKIWNDPNETYPLRVLFLSKKNNKKRWETIVDLLQNTDLTQKEIGAMCGVGRSCVTMINIGENGSQWNDGSIQYPIRKGRITDKKAKERALKIINDLKNTDLLLEEIGKKYGLSTNSISNINTGIRCHFENEDYPIRKNL